MPATRSVACLVREGDTIGMIAQRFQCTVPQLLVWNGLSSHSHLYAGEVRIYLLPHRQSPIRATE
jgi:hypothetical protein